MPNTSDVITLIDMSGKPVRTLSKKADWELEEVKGSTNRLTVEVPLSDGFGLTTDQELIFRGKRYSISEVSRHRGSKSITVIADESQVELSHRNIKKFILKKSTLPDAMKKAVSGSKWTVGYIFADATNEYYAEIENKSSMYCLSFLENQSGGQLVFDSVNRVVSMVKVAEQIPDKTFVYKKNMEDISKTEIQPSATIMYPYGKDGMTVASLNADKEYIEDFSWYLSLGVKLDEARAKYSKEFVWKDDRYIYPANLLRDAQAKLSTMANPQITYSIKASGMDDVRLSEAVFVIDNELGIKIKTTVSRLKVCKDSSKNEFELDYLPASLGAIFDEGTVGDSTSEGKETSIFVVKNPSQVTVMTAPSIALSASVSVYTSTYFEIGFSMMFEVTKAGLLEGYFMMDGNRLPTEIKQTVGVGWYTIGFPFILTGVQAGSKHLDLYLSTTGAITIKKEKIEMSIKSQGAYGGMSNDRPDQRVTETVVIEGKVHQVKATESNKIQLYTPDALSVRETVVISETVGKVSPTEGVTITIKQV